MMIKVFIFLILTVLSPVAQGMDQRELSSQSSSKKRQQSIDYKERAALGSTDFLHNTEISMHGNELTTDLANEIKENLEKNSGLLSLTITDHDGFGVCDDKMEIIASGLPGNSTLTNLDLQGSLVDFSIPNLIDPLPGNSTLKRLNLSGTFLGSEHKHTKRISDVLEINSSLSTLVLLDTCINYDGTKALAKGLSKNRSLTEFWLESYGDKIGALKEIAEALTTHTSLVVLRFFCASVLPEEISAIASTIKVNSTLKSIWLGVVSFEENEEEMDYALLKVLKALCCNITMIEFKFYFPPWDEEEERFQQYDCSEKDLLDGTTGQSIGKQLVLNGIHQDYPNSLLGGGDEGRKLFEIMLCCWILPNELVKLLVENVIHVKKNIL